MNNELILFTGGTTLLILSVMIFRFIKKLENSTQALEESDVRLKEAQSIAKLGSWQWDIVTNKITWSDELYRIYGLKPQEFEATYEAFMKYIHPDDKKMVDSTVKQALKDKKPFGFDHKIVLPDGTIKVLHGQGKIVIDQNGQPVKMVGTALDITLLKQAEEKLQKRTEELERMNKLMVGRELKMIELKKELNKLKGKNG